MHNVLPIFATPIYRSNVTLPSDIIANAKALEYKRMTSNNGCLSTEHRVADNIKFSFVRDIILEHTDIFTREYMRIDNSITFSIENSWITVHGKGDYAQPHRHNNSVFSGIMYLDVDEASGDLCFHNEYSGSNTPYPSTMPLPVSDYNIFNSLEWKFTPKSGDIFIFPSGLIHSVSPSASDNTRYCLSFNLYPRGIINKGTIHELHI